MKPLKNINWPRRLLTVSIACCAMFFVLTATAMCIYPGGTIDHPTLPHYQFFDQPFSDLGRTRLFNGKINLPTMICFITAMTLGGLGLTSFFTAFATSMKSCRTSRICSRGGAALGFLAAVGFLGVACTPWNLYATLHMQFVQCAFRSLLLATVLCLVALAFENRRDIRLMIPFVTFIILLFAYIVLLTRGMSGGPLGGARIQATGQKVIVYSAILMVIVQAMQLRVRSTASSD